MPHSEGLRRYPRTELSSEAYIMDDDGYGFFLNATNLSRGGVFLVTDLLLDEGFSCFLRMELEDGRAINAHGYVCRANSVPHSRYPSGVAITFDYLDKGSEDVLASLTSPERIHGPS